MFRPGKAILARKPILLLQALLHVLLRFHSFQLFFLLSGFVGLIEGRCGSNGRMTEPSRRPLDQRLSKAIIPKDYRKEIARCLRIMR